MRPSTNPKTSLAASQKQQDPSPDRSSAAARIRDNQRRSRARHREFVNELKAKIREYERQGVQATLEMRRAARRVALENSRLRSLLASRGVTDDEVNQYLASFDNQASGTLPTTTLRPHSSPTVKVAPQPPAPDLGLSRPDRDVPGDNGASAPTALDALAVVADASARQTCCGPTTQCSPADGRDAHRQGHIVLAEPSPCTGSLASPSPGADTPPSTATASSHLEMSCSAAAHIMAGMYRDGDRELVREALGCDGPGECLVKNTLVLQLLDNAEMG